MNKTLPNYKNRMLRILGNVLALMLLIALVVIGVIRTPSGQRFIVEKSVDYISDKIGTQVSIDRLFVTYQGNISIEGLYVEDLNQDTLIYSRSLEVDVPFWPIIQGEEIAVDQVRWDGLRAKVMRGETVESFNFDFILKAFAANENQTPNNETQSSEPLELDLGTFNFSDFEIDYRDQYLGIESRVDLGVLNLELIDVDIESMHFEIGDAQLLDIDVSYRQGTSLASSSEQANSASPFVSANTLRLDRVAIEYASEVDGIRADVDLGKLQLDDPEIDLGLSRYSGQRIMLNDSRLDIQVNDVTPLERVMEEGSLTSDTTGVNGWPDLTSQFDEIRLKNNTIHYSRNGKQPRIGEFDPEAVKISNLKLTAANMRVADQALDLQLEELSFQEASGLDLKKLRFDFALSDNKAAITQLDFSLNKSRLKGQLSGIYPSIQSVLDNPAVLTTNLGLEELAIDLNDVLLLDPELKSNQQFVELSDQMVTGQVSISGTSEKLKVQDSNLSWGQDLNIEVSGVVSNVLDMDNIQFDMPQISVEATREDILKFISEDSIGVRLPDQFSLDADVIGDLKKMDGNVLLLSDLGDVEIVGSFDLEDAISYQIDGSVVNFRVDELLDNEELGTLVMTIESQGSGTDLTTLSSTLQATIQEFTFQDYAIIDLEIEGEMQEGKGWVLSDYSDDNLKAQLNGDIRLDTIRPMYDLSFDLLDLNLEAFGLVDEPSRISLELDASLSGEFDDFTLVAEINDGILSQKSKNYPLGTLSLDGLMSVDTTSLVIRNEIINLDLNSNTDAMNVVTALTDHIAAGLSLDSLSSLHESSSTRLKMDGIIAPNSLISEVLLESMSEMDTIRFMVDFDDNAQWIKADVEAPLIAYDGYRADSMYLTANTELENFNFNLGFAHVKSESILIKETQLTGREVDGAIKLRFDTVDEEETIFHVNSSLEGLFGLGDEAVRFSIDPDSFIINNASWMIPASNELVVEKEKISVADFVISNGSQSIEITDDYSSQSKEQLAVRFEQFELYDILSYINSEEDLGSGIIDGVVVVEEPFGNIGLLADLDITSMSMLDVDLGNLHFDAESSGLQDYRVDVSVQDGDVDLDLIGNIEAEGSNPIFDFDLDIDRMAVKILDSLFQGDIAESSGYVGGDFTIDGSLESLEYSGQLNFEEVEFKILSLNSNFSIPNESMTLTSDALQLYEFTVLDSGGNSFDLSGKILTEDLLNPVFDLQLDTKDFQVLDATSDDNDIVYGVVVFDATGTIKGDLEVPVIDLQLQLDQESDFTYVLPSAVAEVEKMDGVVVFVNNADEVVDPTTPTDEVYEISGFDVNASIKIDELATIKMIIDQDTGDNIEVAGNADLEFGMEPDGRISLAGVYNVSSGSYELNLYELVNRRFELRPESKVIWSGDPFDAQLDIRALYEIETSSSALMAGVTSGMSPTEQNRYKQVLPFYVYLDIDGELEAPEISFSLDMPADEQGAISGQVYERVIQVNQQEEELNKQVFSLLVLGRFYPESGSDGSGGGVASVVRNNINDAIADQLNIFSDKLLGESGVEIDFGLDSYTDYQGDVATDRTQLEVAANKNFFNDRLSVSVGSEVDIEGGGGTADGTTPLVGKVSLAYVLTEDGRYVLKGFRRNEYENVIDGQTIVSGIGLVFSQEFNEFEELWDALILKERKNNSKNQKSEQ